jgi:hypothetical protein
MKHPNYPKATNQYLATSSTSLPKSSKENLERTLKDFAIRLKQVSERIEKERGVKAA